MDYLIHRICRACRNLPFSPQVVKIKKTCSFQILTKDHVTVKVDAVMYCKIIDPVASVTKVANVAASSKLLGATTLRNVLGTKNMNEILSQREAINAMMKVNISLSHDTSSTYFPRYPIKVKNIVCRHFLFSFTFQLRLSKKLISGTKKLTVRYP